MIERRQFRKSIYLPLDADRDCPEWADIVPWDVELSLDAIHKRTAFAKWVRRLWCRIVGHRIKTYKGGFMYKAMRGNLFGDRKGQESKPQRYYKSVRLKEGYCSCCGEHFSNTYIKKHKIK